MGDQPLVPSLVRIPGLKNEVRQTYIIEKFDKDRKIHHFMTDGDFFTLLIPNPGQPWDYHFHTVEILP